MNCPSCGKSLKCAECGAEFVDTDVLFQGPETKICPFITRPHVYLIRSGHVTTGTFLAKVSCIKEQCVAWEADPGRCKLIAG